MGNCCDRLELVSDEDYIDQKYNFEMNKDKFSNSTFSFIENFEDKINLLKLITIENYLLFLNNFNQEKIEENNTMTPYTENEASQNYKKTTFLNELLTENQFKIFINKISLKNSLISNQISSDEKLLFIFEKFLCMLFWNFQQFLFNNKQQDFSDYIYVPKFLIATLGFSFCQCKLSQKTNAMINILINKKGLITLKNYRVQSFFSCYVRNALDISINYLLNEIERNQYIKTHEIEQYLGGKKMFEKLIDNFYLKKETIDNISLIFIKKDKINEKIIHEFNLVGLVEGFISDISKTIFGSAGINELTPDEFKKFIFDEEEGGGFWLLFNEGIRKKFEFYIEQQTA